MAGQVDEGSTARVAATRIGLTRRDFLTTVGAGAVGLGLAACGKSKGNSTVSVPSATSTAIRADLSFVYLGTADQQTSWNKLFAQFNTKYPNIKLHPNAVAVDNWAAFFDKVSTQLAGGVKYDLVQVATEGMQLLADRGILRPIDDLMERDKTELAGFLADVHPNLLAWNKKYASPGGKTYFLPSGGFNTMCAWVNTDVFKKAKLDLPTDDWTWQDFLSAGRTIKKTTGAYLYPATAEYFICVMPWLTTNGTSTLDSEWKTPTCDSDAAIEAAHFVRQLVVEGLSPAPGGSFDRFTLGIQGKLAMFGGGRWPIIQIRQANAVGKYNLLRWPHNKAMHGSPVGWGAFALFKNTKSPNGCWDFDKYLGSPEGATFFAQQGGTITPSLKSVASGQAYLSKSPTGTEKLWQALDYATPIPSPAKGNLIQKAIEDTWGQILVGTVKPDTGMKRMADQIHQYL
jgi:multiple sugar transport system substrate-binding protein